MKFTIDIPDCPVLLNDILRTPARHQSRLKQNGKKNKLGYKQLKQYFDALPSFEKPIKITIQIYQTKKHPIDIDSVNKTILDALKFFMIIVDDNEKGIKKLTNVYARGYHDKKRIKLTIQD